MADYALLSERYWKKFDRMQLSCERDFASVAEQVLSVCGYGRILDVGCGRGELVHEMLKCAANAYGLDISASAVELCRKMSPTRFVEGSVLSLPFRDNEFDTIVSTFCLEYLLEDDIGPALTELYRVTNRHLFLRIAIVDDAQTGSRHTIRDRAWWERRCFDAGFRKHPAYYSVNSYESLDQDGTEITIPLEKISVQVLANYPLGALLKERDLHMDMSRESGPRSDAHMARYALAAAWVRPGDTVLDCACGYGYGTAILAACSRGGRFIGVDVEPEVIRYASDHFSTASPVEYMHGDAGNLDSISDASIDVLVTFETIEHVRDYQAFLREARRVIKPDGRIIAGVPNLWMDETGKDPNPYHYHVFDYPKLRAALEDNGFMVEARYSQSAPGGFKLTDSRRLLIKQRLDQDENEPDTEWCLLVASSNPLDRVVADYRHPEFGTGEAGNIPPVVDFSRYYDNPWLYRSLVQLGERVSDAGVLVRLAEQVLSSSRKSSSDYGAALCVLGYSQLNKQDFSQTAMAGLLKLIDKYLINDSQNPHVLRWQISLAYLGGVMTLRAGSHSDALDYFARVIERNACLFSPLLATKTISACLYSGLIHLGSGDEGRARASLTRGIEAARYALHYPDENAIGDIEKPFAFGFPELSEVADLAGQCASALNEIGRRKYAPGGLWRAVNVKRFGLVTWNMELQQELAELHARLGERQTAQAKLDTVIQHFENIRSVAWLFKLYFWPLRILLRIRNAFRS